MRTRSPSHSFMQVPTTASGAGRICVLHADRRPWTTFVLRRKLCHFLRYTGRCIPQGSLSYPKVSPVSFQLTRDPVNVRRREVSLPPQLASNPADASCLAGLEMRHSNSSSIALVSANRVSFAPYSRSSGVPTARHSHSSPLIPLPTIPLTPLAPSVLPQPSNHHL